MALVSAAAASFYEFSLFTLQLKKERDIIKNTRLLMTFVKSMLPGPVRGIANVQKTFDELLKVQLEELLKKIEREGHTTGFGLQDSAINAFGV